MAETREYNIKYATIVFKYREPAGEFYPNASRLLDAITAMVMNYNSNSAKYGYSQFDIAGFYIDTDEIDIDTQNEKYNDIKDKQHSKLK